MTAQIGDRYTFRDKEYIIAATSGPLSFNPKEYRLEGQHICTACWRGYWCEYEISEDGIILEKLAKKEEFGKVGKDGQQEKMQVVQFEKSAVY